MTLTWSNSSLFNYSYSDVSRAILRKYPNPYAAHVVSIDTSSVELDPATGILRVERIIGARQPPPKWIDKFVGGIGSTYVREVSFIVPDSNGQGTPAILQASRNLSLSSIILCHERISYEACKENSGATIFRQLADFVAQGSVAADTFGARIGKKIEQVSVDRFASNADVGHQGFQSVLDFLYQDKDNAKL